MALLVALRNATLPVSRAADPFPPQNVAFCSADTFKFSAAAAPPKSYDEPLREKSVTIRHCAGGRGRRKRDDGNGTHFTFVSIKSARNGETPSISLGRKGGRKGGRERKRKEKKRQKSVFTPFCIEGRPL